MRVFHGCIDEELDFRRMSEKVMAVGLTRAWVGQEKMLNRLWLLDLRSEISSGPVFRRASSSSCSLSTHHEAVILWATGLVVYTDSNVHFLILKLSVCLSLFDLIRSYVFLAATPRHSFSARAVAVLSLSCSTPISLPAIMHSAV